MHLLITCEHGGNLIPQRWRSCFKGAEQALNSHRGYDPGALELAQEIQKAFQTPFIFSTTSRLVVELNRSLHHPNLFSKWTKDLSIEQKDVILEEFYFPYRKQVEKVISQSVPVLHISVHSFTPVLDGENRKAEIGLLYDPQRKQEKFYAAALKKALKNTLSSEMRIRSNYPYLGKADGLTTYLRKRWSDSAYSGIELEVNQKLVNSSKWTQIKQGIIEGLSKLIELN